MPAKYEKDTTRILIVEDEEGVRQALAKIIESFSFKVVTAPDGDAALKLFDGQKFDIVLTDLSLPGLSGWDVAAEIKARDPKMPVVLLSGWDISDEDLKMHWQVEAVLSKPVKIKDLIKTINELCAIDRRNDEK